MNVAAAVKYGFLAIAGAATLGVGLLFSGILITEQSSHACFFIKQKPTAKVLFFRPADFSAEDGYRAYIRSLPPDSPKRHTMEDYYQYVLSPASPCDDNRFWVCL